MLCKSSSPHPPPRVFSVLFAQPFNSNSSDLGDIVFTGDMYPYIRFWFHEIGHIRDRNVNASAGDYSGTHILNPFPNTEIYRSANRQPASDAWLTEYDKDEYICDAYAKTSTCSAQSLLGGGLLTWFAIYLDNAENFAQEVVVAGYDKIVPGGIAGLVPNYQDIYNQFVNVQEVMGDELCPGGTCDRLFEDEYGPLTPYPIPHTPPLFLFFQGIEWTC
jgi:hypothetical protein